MGIALRSPLLRSALHGEGRDPCASSFILTGKRLTVEDTRSDLLPPFLAGGIPMRSVRLLLITLVSLCGVLAAQNNAIPYVNTPLVPTSAVPGSAGFELTVNGSGFVAGSVVNWNGSARVTTFISTSQLQAAILSTDLASVGTASITVRNPAPGG